jgi:hypothetical protein
MEVYFLQMNSVFFLSLWKTYVRPALSVPYGFSYIEMFLFTISPAMISASVVLRFQYQINILLGKLLPKKDNKPSFKPKFRKYLRFWHRYGFYGVMILTPILVGIPLGVWLSARLGVPKAKIMITLFVFSVIWASLSYYTALSGLDLIGN